MIKDIGTEGLRVVDVAPPNHTYDPFNEGRDLILTDENISLDMIDVTTAADTERKYIQAFTGNQGTM